MNSDLVTELTRIADNYRAQGDLFRNKAYRNAANNISKLSIQITSGQQAREQIKGIGDSVQKSIDTYLSQGVSDRFQTDEELTKTLKLFEGVHGIGPVKAKKLYDEGYRTIDDLGEAELTHAQQIGLKYYDDLKLKIPRSEMDMFNELFHLNYDHHRLTWTIAGSYRRGAPESGDIDLLVKQDMLEDGDVLHLSDVKNVLQPYIVADLTNTNGDKYMGVIQLEDCPARRLDIRLIKPESYYYALLYFTGSKELNITMRNRAIELGLTLNEYGLNGLQAHSEEEIFKHLGMEYIPPNMR